ncbi:MAG: hypothetical protein B7Z52_03755 [Burkholderiales bacterium 12-64-5]|nr:MAG: hypothetical protein B7Z52_03755 [Burkholderiales bacterium 12-64-5]
MNPTICSAPDAFRSASASPAPFFEDRHHADQPHRVRLRSRFEATGDDACLGRRSLCPPVAHESLPPVAHALVFGSLAALFSVSALADHNSPMGAGWANMPNDIHNTQIEEARVTSLVL